MIGSFIKTVTIFACGTLLTVSSTLAQPAQPVCDATMWNATKTDIHWTLVDDAGAIKCVQDSWRNLGGLTQAVAACNPSIKSNANQSRDRYSNWCKANVCNYIHSLKTNDGAAWDAPC